MKTRANAYQPTRVWQTGALAVGVMLNSLASGPAQAGPIITFDAPGAGTGTGEGTYPVNINDFGVARRSPPPRLSNFERIAVLIFAASALVAMAFCAFEWFHLFSSGALDQIVHAILTR
jgi:hypothetical protein